MAEALAYTWCHLLSFAVMDLFIGFTEDVVSLMLKPTGTVIPIGPLPAWFVIRMEPDFWSRRNHSIRRDTGDVSCHQSSLVVCNCLLSTAKIIPASASICLITQTGET